MNKEMDKRILRTLHRINDFLNGVEPDNRKDKVVFDVWTNSYMYQRPLHELADKLMCTIAKYYGHKEISDLYKDISNDHFWYE